MGFLSGFLSAQSSQNLSESALEKQNVFTASDTSAVCGCQLLHASVVFCFINFCCKMMKTLEKSLFDRSVVKCEQLIQLWQKLSFCIFCCSQSEELEIRHGVLWALKHQDGLTMACVRKVSTEKNVLPFSFHLQKMKEKQRKRVRILLFLQVEWTEISQ